MYEYNLTNNYTNPYYLPSCNLTVARSNPKKYLGYFKYFKFAFILYYQH